MRPHDIVVLLKIAAKGTEEWKMKDLALELGISAGEVSESLHRSMFAGLISADKKQLMKSSIIEFLQFGLKYVFPQRPGAMSKGMPTAYSATPLSLQIASEEAVVWPVANGKVRGHALEPLYSGVPQACKKDPKLYELLALVDAFRVGRAREKAIALEELKKRIE